MRVCCIIGRVDTRTPGVSEPWFRHWMREARICENDGHPDAARFAYAQAADVAPSPAQRSIATELGASLPREG